jgi:hypothetical protein
MIDKELWDRFLKGELAMNCRTEIEVHKFSEYCKKQGINVNYKQNLLFYKENNDIYLACSSNKNLLFQNEAFYIQNNIKIITYSQLFKPEPEKREYKGWEILKMINDDILKENDELLWNNTLLLYIDKYGNLIYEGENTEAGNSILNSIFTFTIKEKEPEYLTFDEARKTGKKFKYKTWRYYYYGLHDILDILTYHSDDKINRMLDEKAWEVEE